jgi:antitoxin YefM
MSSSTSAIGSAGRSDDASIRRHLATVLAVGTVPLSEARDQLSALIDEVVRTHDTVTITRNGVPAAVVLSADEYDSILETLELLNDPIDRERLEEAEASLIDGDTTTRDEMAALIRQYRRAAPSSRWPDSGAAPTRLGARTDAPGGAAG